MGTKVGRGVCMIGAVAAEYEQVQIGEGTVINSGSFLLTHTVESRCAKIRPVNIGKRVTIGALCAVLPDASMGDGSYLADVSLVSATVRLQCHCIYRGDVKPARTILVEHGKACRQIAWLGLGIVGCIWTCRAQL